MEMIDVGHKRATQRRARARGIIRMGAQALQLVKEGRLPKGDALALARVAGVMAAKRTAELVPLCHPLPIDSVKVECEVDGALAAVVARCEVSTVAKTGVEMEALTGVHGALLCVYDLVKGVDPALEIGEILLERKEGGKGGAWIHPKCREAEAVRESMAGPRDAPLAGKRAAVLTVSDRVFQGKRGDQSGPALKALLAGLGAEISESGVVPDEKDRIVEFVRRALRAGRVDLVVTTGGTGLGPRDVTPEALASICSKTVPGIAEMMRAAGSHYTPYSYLSRAVAGICDGALVVALPGSPKAVEQGLEALREVLPHALSIASGEDH